MTPEWPDHLSVKNTLYTLKTHPEAQISLRFALRPAVFQKIGNALNDL